MSVNGKVQHNTATVDHLRTKFDASRRDINLQQDRRRVLACHKCNWLRGQEDVLSHRELQRKRSGTIALHERPYPERHKHLTTLKKIAESGVAGLVNVMGKPRYARIGGIRVRVPT